MGKQALTTQLKANGVPTSKKDLVNMGQQAVVTQMAANGLPTTRQGLSDMAKTQGQDWAVEQMSSALTKAGLPASVEALLAQELKARMEKRKSARDRSFDDTPPEAPTQARPKLVLDPPVRSDSLSFDVVILTLLILRQRPLPPWPRNDEDKLMLQRFMSCYIRRGVPAHKTFIRLPLLRYRQELYKTIPGAVRSAKLFLWSGCTAFDS